MELGKEEVLQIVNTLVYDGKVDQFDEHEKGEGDADDAKGDGDVGNDERDYGDGEKVTLLRPRRVPGARKISLDVGAVRGVPGVQRVPPRGSDLSGDVRVHGGVARTGDGPRRLLA